MYGKVILGGITAIVSASTFIIGAGTDADGNPVKSGLTMKTPSAATPTSTATGFAPTKEPGSKLGSPKSLTAVVGGKASAASSSGSGKVFENPWEAIKAGSKGTSGPVGGTANLNYIATFEDLALGLIVGQVEPADGLWCRFGFPGCPPGADPASGIDPHVCAINPFAGFQHLCMFGDPAFPPGTLIRAISPTKPVPGMVALAITRMVIYISNGLGADYHVRPTSPALGLVNSYTVFHFADFAAVAPNVGDPDAIGPDIVMLDDPPGPPGLAFYTNSTSTEWVPGVYMEFTTISDPNTNTIRYYYNVPGALLTLIHTGTVFGATTVENVQFRSDNFQLLDEFGAVDNVTVDIKPKPGACCTGTSCTETMDLACPPPSVWQGPGTVCAPNPCLQGACCRMAGQACTEEAAATCVPPGVFIPGGVCTPNCCIAPATGTDSCAMQAPIRIPTPPTQASPANSRVYTGNNSLATGPDPCEAQFGGFCSITQAAGCVVDADCPMGETCIQDPLWWESFTINECSDVTIDYCCSPPIFSPVYAVLYNGCPCGAPAEGILANDFSDVFGGTLPPICPDDNFHAVWNDLKTGTYWYPIYSNTDGSIGDYQLHISVARAGEGRCCAAGICTPNVCEAECDMMNGVYGGDGSVCLPGVCGTGACCNNVTGLCADGVAVAACQPPNSFFGGIMCANVTCPPTNNNCAKADTLENGHTLVDTTAATTDGPALAAAVGTCGVGQIFNDVWYNYTATCTGTLTISGCDAANFDSIIAIYGAGCPAVDPPLACDDDGCGVGGGPSEVSLAVTTGQSFKIRIGAFAAAGQGQMIVKTRVVPTGGGCCSPAGVCTNVAGPANCPAPSQYNDGQCCKDLICNAAGSCDWDNGDGDPLKTALASQSAPKELFVEAADDFILKGSSTLDCEIDSIEFWVFHFNKDIFGCEGGLCLCNNGDLFAETQVCVGGPTPGIACMNDGNCGAGGTCPPQPDECAAGTGPCVAVTEGRCASNGAFCVVGGAVPDFDCKNGMDGACNPFVCTNTPADYSAVKVTVYNDAQGAGVVKVAEFAPDLAIPDCDGLVNAPADDIQVLAAGDIGNCNNIVDLDVDLLIEHTFVGDLVVDLTHDPDGPGGVAALTQRLMSRVGGVEVPAGALCLDNSAVQGSGSDNVGTIDLANQIPIILDDQAVNLVETGPFPLTGGNHYVPSSGNLAAFNGRSKCGTWTLTVQDGEELDDGILLKWALSFNNSGPVDPKGPTGYPHLVCQAPPAAVGDECNVNADCDVAPGDGVCGDAATFGIFKVAEDILPANIIWEPFEKPIGVINENMYLVTLNVAGHNIVLEQNKKNWLAIAPIVPVVGFYQTGWMSNQKLKLEHKAQQYFPPPEAWQVTDVDLAFKITGVKQPAVGCPCVVDADCKDPACVENNACNCADCVAGTCVFTCQGFGNTNCAGPVDLDDILCMLNGFGNFNLCPDADINPCGGNGVIDLDDILDVLTAFGGGNPCGCLLPPAGVPPGCGGP